MKEMNRNQFTKLLVALGGKELIDQVQREINFHYSRGAEVIALFGENREPGDTNALEFLALGDIIRERLTDPIQSTDDSRSVIVLLDVLLSVLKTPYIVSNLNAVPVETLKLSLLSILQERKLEAEQWLDILTQEARVTHERPAGSA